MWWIELNKISKQQHLPYESYGMTTNKIVSRQWFEAKNESERERDVVLQRNEKFKWQKSMRPICHLKFQQVIFTSVLNVSSYINYTWEY